MDAKESQQLDFKEILKMSILQHCQWILENTLGGFFRLLHQIGNTKPRTKVRNFLKDGNAI